MDAGLLRAVSRSFYLTLRAMPRGVREPLALGYLLARASDSIADTSAAPVGDRVEALERLRGGELPANLEALAAAQSQPAEAALLRQLPVLVAALAVSEDRDALIGVWAHILRGQVFDLTRFPSDHPLTPAELDEYTFLVAGCVGEFWTRLCFARLRDFSSEPLEQMVTRGVAYGRGLQLINILRDRRADAAAGRIYLEPESVESARQAAGEGLTQGEEWVRAVRRGRVRYACILPVRIGRETLAALGADAAPAKISRARVRGILGQSLPWLWRVPA